MRGGRQGGRAPKRELTLPPGVDDVRPARADAWMLASTFAQLLERMKAAEQIVTCIEKRSESRNEGKERKVWKTRARRSDGRSVPSSPHLPLLLEHTRVTVT